MNPTEQEIAAQVKTAREVLEPCIGGNIPELKKHYEHLLGRIATAIAAASSPRVALIEPTEFTRGYEQAREDFTKLANDTAKRYSKGTFNDCSREVRACEEIAATIRSLVPKVEEEGRANGKV